MRYSNTLKEGRGDTSRLYQKGSRVGEEGCSRLTVMRAGPDAVWWKGSRTRGREGASPRGQLKGGEGRADEHQAGAQEAASTKDL